MQFRPGSFNMIRGLLGMRAWIDWHGISARIIGAGLHRSCSFFILRNAITILSLMSNIDLTTCSAHGMLGYPVIRMDDFHMSEEVGVDPKIETGE
jgi:hypothetical protein